MDDSSLFSSSSDFDILQCKSPYVTNTKHKTKLASEVTWLHGANTVEQLAQLSSSRGEVDVVEVDVLLHPFRRSAVVGHDFLDVVFAEEFKAWFSSFPPGVGLKLDLKDFECLPLCLEVMQESLGSKREGGKEPQEREELEAEQQQSDNTEEPSRGTPSSLWINADISNGPGGLFGPGGPLGPSPTSELRTNILTQTLTLASTTSTPIILSLGWCTSHVPFLSLRYTHEHINDLLSLLLPVQDLLPLVHITFPVRGSLVQKSADELRYLLSMVSNSSLTIWGGSEGVSNQLRSFAMETFSPDRVYFDLPP